MISLWLKISNVVIQAVYSRKYILQYIVIILQHVTSFLLIFDILSSHKSNPINDKWATYTKFNLASKTQYQNKLFMYHKLLLLACSLKIYMHNIQINLVTTLMSLFLMQNSFLSVFLHKTLFYHIPQKQHKIHTYGCI